MSSAVRLMPTQADWRSSYGSLLYEAGMLQPAERELRAAIALAPGVAQYYWDLATALAGEKFKKYDDAIALFSAARHLRKPAVGEVIKEAMAHEKRKAPGWDAVTVALYDEALSHSPQSPMLNHNLGEMRLQLGDISQAVAAYQRATRLCPVSKFTEQRLGDSLVFRQRYGDAHRSYVKAFELKRGLGARGTSGGLLRRWGPAVSPCGGIEDTDARSVCLMADPRGGYETLNLTAAHKLHPRRSAA